MTGRQNQKPSTVTTTWTEEKNLIRGELIDKEIEGTISQDEQLRLDELQAEMLEYRRSVTPLSLAELRAFHQKLLDSGG